MIARNSKCSCGSGKRFKHCCGDLRAKIDWSAHISDEQLINALKVADDEGIRLGREPSARSIQNIGDALRQFGYHSFILMGRGAPEIVQRAHSLNDTLFVPKELQTGGMHLGAFLFRDMFCRLYAPIAFGTTRIDFFKMVDLSDFQKRWLAELPNELSMFVDQASDILDFGYGFSEFGHGRKLDPRGSDLIWRAHVQLEAAAATATSAYDYRGTVQSSLLGTELALKAGLAALGISNSVLRSKRIGHDLVKAAKMLGSLTPTFDLDRVLRVVSRFPDFVSSRYDAPSPSRIDTGHILMGAQYVASEVTRQFSDRNGRLSNPGSPPRVYPA